METSHEGDGFEEAIDPSIEEPATPASDDTAALEAAETPEEFDELEGSTELPEPVADPEAVADEEE
jgi:hypothetical protein